MVSQRLWSPWRLEYVAAATDETSNCPFCTDRQTAAGVPELIVKAGRLTYATLNLFPYNNGHLMVLPYRHVADIVDLAPEEAAELMHLLTQGRRALGDALGPDAFNVGMNLGRAAGAGIPAHLHFHLVPRWEGDTSFMAVTADTKVLPESLDQTKRRLIEAWPSDDGTPQTTPPGAD